MGNETLQQIENPRGKSWEHVGKLWIICHGYEQSLFKCPILNQKSPMLKNPSQLLI